ncbi:MULTISPECIES: FmdB family zinc ribbon protein [unclassified Amycolatopsis]|uniref:FmdB family zinc ribbon protein n=1 Tax=unclassified Amycolatopsis TaxID=2618356 RepID=UPI001FF53E25|nr:MULTISPECIES: FmdB family zinc ribbon protein [unclassified Amycolatopsis]UOZ07917.1 FmdB family transcriptional regulator [Amycolatopsis sp. WQ 127309]WSJ74198.1 FmdB family transcriptional regulator [Amycolatopsis sp. NBC_01307]WSK82201.1 FmdB family transcriptional regulator [Amycolatopsis sp. NBC_01286]
MPTYQYACKECDHRFEAVQSFSDPSLTVCPQCSGPLRKVFSSVGVVFKGSGFYRTDSREASKSSTTSTPAKSEGKSEGKSESKPETKTESKPKSDSGSASSSSGTTKTAAAAS